MKIAIYTSSLCCSFNNYNISKLLNAFPNNEYLFLIVKNNNPSLFNRFKQIIVEYRDGKNYLKKDLKILDEKIDRITEKFDFRKFLCYKVDDVNDSQSEEILKKFKPDIILQAGAGILKRNIFSLSRISTINIHHGLAPEIRGINSTFWCLYYGLYNSIGVSCHIIDEGLDTGPIISQFKYPYQANDTFVDIQYTLCIEGGKLLLHSIELLSKEYPNMFSVEEVKSYYFSNVNYLDYNRLRTNNFLQIETPDHLKVKEKRKNIFRLQ